MTRGRSRARRVLTVVGLVLGVLPVLVLAGFGFLFTDPGERLLKDLVVSSLEEAAFEKADVARLEFHGDRVVLFEVTGRAADNQPAFAADEVEVDLSLWSLFGGGLHLNRLALTGYSLHLQRRADGSWNLSKEKPQQPGKPLPDFSIDELALSSGSLEVRAGDDELQVAGLGITGGVVHRDQRWSGSLAVNGEVTRPTRVPLAISAAAQSDGRIQRAEIDATAGETRLSARVSTPLEDRDDASRLANLAGQLELNIPAFTSAGFKYGPVRVSARLREDQLQVDQLHLELPGLLAASDQTGAGAFSGTMKIVDLSAASRALQALLGRSFPDLAGRGELRVRIDNPITSAGLVLNGQFQSLDAGGMQSREVKLQGRVADLTRPAEGQLTADAASVVAGARQLRGVHLKVQRQAGHALLDAELRQPLPASLHVEATQADEDDPIRLEQLVLTYPGATWRSGAPGQLRFEEDGVVIDSLTLASAGQKIMLQGAWGTAKKQLELKLSGIRLENLPTALLPEELDPAGLVEGELKVSQPREQLEGSANLNLSQARLAGLSGLSGRVAAKISGARLTGSVNGSALEGTIAGRFDLPASPGSRTGAKLSANLTLQNASVSGIWGLVEGRVSKEALSRVKNPSGRLSGSVEVSGTWAEPSLKTQLTIDEGAITFEGAPRYTAITMRAEAEATRRQLTLSNLQVRTQQGRLEVSGTATRTDPKRPFAYRLKTSAERFPLPLESPVLATFKANLDGTISEERITSKVSVTSLRLDSVPSPAPPRPGA